MPCTAFWPAAYEAYGTDTYAGSWPGVSCRLECSTPVLAMIRAS